ncbi:MAG: hypothetical protein WB297_02045 [Actinomycetota bacterium]
MNPDLEQDMQRWEARTASLDEIEALHPGQDVGGLAELHARLGLLTQEATPDPQAGWELLQNRLPEKVPTFVHIDRPGGRRRYPRTRKRAVVLALAAALMLTSGLAVAGALPAPVQDAIAILAGRLGFDLPHASEPSDVTSHGEKVSNFAHSTDTEGCEKGKAVSALASAPADDHRRNPADTPDPCQKMGTSEPSGASVAPASTAPAGSNVGSDAASAHRQGDGSEPASADGSASNSGTATKETPTQSAPAPWIQGGGGQHSGSNGTPRK